MRRVKQDGWDRWCPLRLALVGHALLIASSAGAETSSEQNGAETQMQVDSEHSKRANEATTETEIVVSAERRRATSDPTAAVSLIDGAALLDAGGTAAGVLRAVPGAQLTRAGSAADLSTAGLRGSDASQVPVYVAGVLLIDEVTGVSDLSRVPIWLMDRVEVVRGMSPAGPLRGGLGGALYFEPHYPRRNEIHFGTTVGSYEHTSFRGGGSIATSPSKDGSWSAETSLSVRVEDTRGNFRYFDDGGTAFTPEDDRFAVRPNSDYHVFDLWNLTRLQGRVLETSVNARLVLNGFHREMGVSGLSTIAARAARAESTRELGGATVQLGCGASCSVYFRPRLSRQLEVTLDPLGELGLGTSELAVASLRGGASLELHKELGRVWGTRSWLDAEGAQLRVSEPGAIRSDAQQTTWSAGSELAFWKEPLEARAHGRLTCLNSDGTEELQTVATQACHLEARLGANVAIFERVSARANVGYAVRAPTLGERYGISAGTRGRADLRLERGPSADIGFVSSGTLSGVVWGLETWAFVRWAEDLIVYQRAGLGYVRPTNVGAARLAGLELDARVNVFDSLQLKSALTFLDPRDQSADRTTVNELLPYRSQAVWSLDLEVYRRFEAGLLDRLSLRGFALYRGFRTTDRAGLLVLPSQWSLDMVAAVSMASGALELQGRVENLLDTPLVDAVGYPQPGRTIFIALFGKLAR